MPGTTSLIAFLFVWKGGTPFDDDITGLAIAKQPQQDGHNSYFC
jgi:hypothetical protein